MRKRCLSIGVGVGLTLALVSLANAQENARSFPPDTTQYSRPAIGADRAAPAQEAPRPSAAPGANIVSVVDVVVNNTNANLKNTDTFNDGETSIAINPLNKNEIVISAFSGSWGAFAPIWHSTDGGATWTKQFTIPVPPGVSAAGCPCDQTFDYGTDGVLFGAFLTGETNIYSGSTTNPANAGAWSWWTSGGVAQPTNQLASSHNNADQPWLLHNSGTFGAFVSQNVFVAYDNFAVSPVGMQVSASVNQTPPVFSTGKDVSDGTTAGAINPGHRLAQDPRNGWIYSLYQNCITNCATLAANPKTIEYHLNRSTDQGSTWTLNGSATGIVVATADSTQPQPKFGTVNALLGGVLHAAVDPNSGDLYYVYGNRDASGNNRLAVRRVSGNGAGGVTVGPESFVVSGTVQAALPSVAVTDTGTVGVFYYTYNGMVSGFPQFSAWLATSTDRGATFSNQLLATFLSPATDNSDGRQRVFGDYMQTKAVGECFMGAFTANGAAFGRATSNNDPIFYKACVPPFVTVSNSHLDNASPRMSGRLNRNGVASGCSASKPYPGELNPGTTYNYVTKAFAYAGPAACVTFRMESGTCDVGAHLSLYNGGFNPANKATNYLGDTGSSGIGTAMSVNLAANQKVVVVVNGNNGIANCTFTVTANTSALVPLPSAHDFDADARSDILWRHTGGDVAIWEMNGTATKLAVDIGNVPTAWQLAGTASLVQSTGDFDGDGKADLLWRHSGGDVAIYLMDGVTPKVTLDIGNVPNDWQIAGVGDFNGDGKADILWRHSGGDVAIWLMNGTTPVTKVDIGNVPTIWQIVGVGDFNGDGKADILWRGSGGDVAIWLMNGTTPTAQVAIGNVATAWQIVGVADVDGDGKADLLWRHSGGDVAIWEMNGTATKLALDIGNVPTAWQIVSTGDYDGDGKGDILWRHSGGDVSIWEMDGTTVKSAVDVGNVPTAWTIVE